MRAALALGLALLAAGCDVSMSRQPRYRADAPAGIWQDGASARRLPEGVVAQGDLARIADESNPPPVTTALLARGQERFNIYCSPCHGLDGSGDGIIVRRGFPRPPSFHEARLLSAPAQTFYGAISNGYGVMYSYASRVEPRDRWAIVSYIRALQLSQHAELAQAPDAAEQMR
jgi:mono/diheme cytochrome c family protein